MAEDWTRLEVDATVADYFAMWAKELKHERVNKAEHNAALRAILNDRSKGAVEFKHQNISAVLIELGLPYIEGYKPRGNYQELLRQVVVSTLSARPGIEQVAAMAVEEPAIATDRQVNWAEVIVAPPKRDVPAKPYGSVSQGQVRITKVDYLEREARNRSLGLAGERFVMELEHYRLWNAGRKDLAERVEHVAAVRGDGLGYDVLSFDKDGRERLIEVKTTRFGQMTPFFASRNEIAVSEERAEYFQLYRLFKFDDSPQAFVLGGSLRNSVSLEPVMFKATLP